MRRSLVWELMVFMLTLCAPSVLEAAMPYGLTRGLIFHAGFDGEVKPDLAAGSEKAEAAWGKSKPSTEEKWSFEDGKCGQGLRVEEGKPGVQYYAQGNILPDRSRSEKDSMRRDDQTIVFEGSIKGPRFDKGEDLWTPKANRRPASGVKPRARPLFYRNEEARVDVVIRSASRKSRSLSVTYELLDYREGKVSEISRKYKLSAEGVATDTISLNPHRSGLFKLCAGYKTPDGARVTQDVAIFGILPQASEAEELPMAEDSPFGVHTRLHANYGPRRHMDIARKVGMKWVRLVALDCSSWWSTVEPEKGKLTFLDDDINLAREYGMNILGVLFCTPYWASSAPEGTPKDAFYSHMRYPPKDIGDWENYVTAVVSHWKDKIRYWEVWNEPELGSFWTGTPEDYVTYVGAAYRAAKRADPDCIVVGGGALPLATKAWTERAFKAGLLETIDILSFHGYSEGDYFGAGETRKLDNNLRGSGFAYRDYTYRIDYLKGLMNQYGIVKPIWDTETTVFGATYHSSIDLPELPPVGLWRKESPVVAASELVKLYAINFAKCVEKVFYYYMEDVTDPATANYPQSLWEYDGAPTSRLMAHATLSHLLRGARFAGEARLNDGVYCYVFEKKTGSLAVIWSQWNGKTVMRTQSSPKLFRIIDVMCNQRRMDGKTGKLVLQLTEEPIFLSATMSAGKLLSILGASRVELPRAGKSVSRPSARLRDGFPDALAVGADRWRFVDLRGCANMGFADDAAGDAKGGWGDEGPMNDMRGIEPGRQEFARVPFDIIDPQANGGAGCVVLRGRWGTPDPRFPERVVIKIGGAMKSLYFLHSATWCDQNGKEVGSYTIRYANGKQAVVPLVEGRNTCDWYIKPSSREQTVAVGVKTGEVGPDLKYLRVLEWKNPLPRSEISDVVFETRGAATLILVGITGGAE